ncbi:MAG: SURF1 family protein [Pseudomonadota bacterium]
MQSAQFTTVNEHFKRIRKPKAWGRFASFSIFSICIINLCIGLGVWQLQRLEWKTKLLESLSDTKPSSYTKFPQNQTQVWQEFSKVIMIGTYLPDLEIRLQPRVRQGKVGAHLLSALLTSSGQLVYVLRGWIPLNYVAVPFKGSSQVFGIINFAPKPRWFIPKNNIHSGAWHTIDFEDIQAFLAWKNPELMDQVAPFYILEQPQQRQQSAPIPLGIKRNIKNDHLQYAITWFMLALCILLIYLCCAWKHVKNA